MGVTIYDIAEKARVSIATVSRVFNDHPRVSESTRARVLLVAEELGYQPHASAQSLARRKTHLIAAVIPVMTNHFYMEVMRGMQDALTDSLFDLLVYAAPSPSEVDGQLDRAIQKGRADGLLLLSTPLTDAHRKRLSRVKQPIVLVDATDPDFDAVAVDNVKGGYMATRYLIECGYERIGHVTIAPASAPARQRRRGYENALREAEMDVEVDRIAASPHHGAIMVEEAGYEAMKVLLKRDLDLDAVFVASDIQALGALRALGEAGLRVPADVALVGFDDIVVSKYVGLTTLRQPMYEMGKLAIEKLLLRIEHPDRSHSHTVFSPRLVVRRTCRPSDTGDGLLAASSNMAEE